MLGACGGQEKASNPLGMEIHMVVSHSVVLGPELPLLEPQVLLTTEPVLQHLLSKFHFLK